MQPFNTEQLDSWVDKVLVLWAGNGWPTNEGASPEEIRHAQAELNFPFPSAFRLLYQRANGFPDFAYNPHQFSLWSLQRVLNEYRADGDPNYIGFSDYLINSRSIGFLKSDPGIFRSYNQTVPVALDFQEAIELFNTGSVRLC